jgi:uncharacterized phage protein (TIGR01671 family)
MENRERYLFRGKRTDNGEWTQGVPFIQHNYVSGYDKDDNAILEDRHYIITGCGGIDRSLIANAIFTAIHIDPCTIGQCTGLKDRNGSLIFEGDIVKIRHGDRFSGTGVVEYFNCAFMVKLYKHTIKTKLDDLYTSLQDTSLAPHHPVILGNIHDNPELLEA